MLRTLARGTVVLLFAILARPLPAEDPSTSEEWKAKIKAISEKVAQIRGLSFKREVEVGVKTEKELLEFLKKAIEKEMPDAKIRALQRGYAKMGLVPKYLDLKKTMLDLLTSQIGGFYDPETKSLNVIDHKSGEEGKKNPNAEMMEAGLRMLGLSQDDIVAAHELCHALQDQYFNLMKIQRAVEGDDDRATALKCLIEGDATVLMMDFIADKAPMIKAMMRNNRDMGGMGMPVDPSMKDVPEIILVPLVYPYQGGAALVNEVVKKGGYKAVDALFKDPPLSTEQVLHLDRFFKERDDPTFVAFPEVQALAPGKWELLECNVLGELGSRVLLGGFLPKKDAQAAADGWDGDRFAVFGRGGEAFFFWFSTWDDAKQAGEFARAYVKLLGKKYGFEPGADDFPFEFEKDGETGRVELRGADVVVVEGLSKEECARLCERVFRDAKKTAPVREVAPAPEPGDEGEDARGEIKGKGFTVVPPEGWNVKREKKFGRLVSRPRKGLARFEVGVLELDRPADAQAVGQELQKELPSRLAGFALDEAGLKTEDGRTGYLLMFEGEDPETRVAFRYAMLVLTKGSRAAVLTFMAPRDEFERGPDIEKAQAAAKSFQWK
ncbi:MAG: hypothetical protein MUC63_03980 [Planctomycetes bacterium]|nr:hypothetical protein [Planctomycetota bacterium]